VDAGEQDLVEVTAGQLVISGSDAAHALEPSEVAFDRVAGTVGLAVQGPGLEAGRTRRRDQLPAEPGRQGAHLIALIGPVAEQLRLAQLRSELVRSTPSTSSGSSFA